MTNSAGKFSGLFLLAFLIGQRRSHAQEDQTGTHGVTASATREGSFVPLTVSANVGSTGAYATSYGGYDTARSNGVFAATAEVRLWGPIALRGTAEYGGSTKRMRPSIGLRGQILREELH